MSQLLAKKKKKKNIPSISAQSPISYLERERKPKIKDFKIRHTFNYNTFLFL